jgi:eukaryotic-like serine/threonine-protein kinase
VPDLSGEVLDGRYQVLERLSEGAMGVVYRGTRLQIDRAVAIKVMHASLPEAMEGRKRFEREAKLMARLEHPHCVSIIDYGVHGAKPYVVMELVRGRSLFELLDDDGRIEIPRAVEIMRQALSGLAHAHEQGIIHRDMKPANIMVTPKAPLGVHVRILDFGLARMLEATASMSNGVAVGTPSYMAPEQCRGDALDFRVDIYACGVVLFEMLTGEKPFRARDPIAIVKKQLEEPAPRLADVTPGDYGPLEAIVARALAKSPADRFPSALAMSEALDAASTGRGASEPTTALAPAKREPSIDVPITIGSSIHTKPMSPGSSVRRELPVSRTRWFVLAGILIAAAALAAVIVLQQQLAGDEPERDDSTVIVSTPPPPSTDAAPPRDPADDLAAEATRLADTGKVQAAIDMLAKARQVYPNRVVLALTLGKLYFSKMWWADGLVHLRDAVKLDPTLRSDRELLQLVLRAFITTPRYDDRIARFVIDLGPAMVPLLDETAHKHPRPEIRARAERVLRFVQR